jgi:hypothetical protein
VKFDDVWTPLTDGFKTSLSALPNIVAQQKGPIETALENMLTGLADKHGVGFADFLKKRLDETSAVGQRVKDSILNLFNIPKFKLPDFVAPTVDAADKEKKKSQAETFKNAPSENARFLTGVSSSAGDLIQMKIERHGLDSVKATIDNGRKLDRLIDAILRAGGGDLIVQGGTTS